VQYRSDIDGLRALAVLAVVIHHFSPQYLPGGYVGVDVFFVISGFLITGILRSEISTGEFTFAGFYERRIRRIFPALFAVLAVTLVVAHLVMLPTDLAGTLRGAIGALLFTSNFVFWRDMGAGYFAAADASVNPLLHTWSLAVEEQFYLLFPILLLALRNSSRIRMVVVLTAATLASLLAATALVDTKSVAVFFLSPFRAWELLAGALLAYDAVPNLDRQLIRNLVAAGGLVALLSSCVLYDPDTVFPGFAALVPVLGTAAIIHAGSGGFTRIGAILSTSPLTYIGKISFSLYLWHWPLVVLTRYWLGMEPVAALPLMVAAFLLAAASYHWIEQPFRTHSSLTRQHAFTAAAVATLAMVSVAVFGVAASGYAGRVSSEVASLDRARTPVVPYVQCDRLPTERACRLGRGSVTTVLWGDSHLIALAPAFDAVLRESGEAAVLAATSACPPMRSFQRRNLARSCAAQNADLTSFLEKHSEVHRVVLVGAWSRYFAGEEGAAAGPALIKTVVWLRSRGLEVILFGPVPVYERSVPLTLALERMHKHPMILSTGVSQRDGLRSFYAAAKKSEDLGAQFADPVAWMCRPVCRVSENGAPLYRDENHLSAEGARWLIAPVRGVLFGEGHNLGKGL
jgi:peptidoglycan/LPS O-acetylase OafA/YrhL